MKKIMSAKQIAANRRNAAKSTGPKTKDGKSFSRLNALKHGLRSPEVVVTGKYIKECPREFAALHRSLWEDLKPVGKLEETLVEQIITTVWRMRRVHKAESGEIALSVDGGQWDREKRDNLGLSFWIPCALFGEADTKLKKSSDGNLYLEHLLLGLRTSVQNEGEISETAIKALIDGLGGKPGVLSGKMERLRLRLQQNPEGLDAAALNERALAGIDAELELIESDKLKCQEREEMEEKARQAASVLPSEKILEKLLRFEGSLQKKFFRTMNYLERHQRRRLGEKVPAPIAMEISAGP
jgi:hypothetical protein